MKLRAITLAAVSVSALVALALGAGSARADAPIVTEYRVEPPARLTIGDHVPVTIVVQADRGTRVQIAPGGIPPEVALVSGPNSGSRVVAGDRAEIRIELVIAPFVIGDYPMPPITLRYSESGGATGTVETPSARLLVESTVPSNVQPELRGLKPQAFFPPPPGVPVELAVAAAVAFVVAVILLGIAWWRTHRPLPQPAPAVPAPPLSAEDAARRALDEAGAAFAQTGDHGAYYASLSNTVRTYLTARFGFPAFALTTAELQERMVRAGMDRWQARLAGGLLEQCDSVMWAGYEPAAERADHDLTAAYEIIEMSRPEPEPETAGVT